MFTCLKELHNGGAPVSRGTALCQAINFVGGLLGVCVNAVRKRRPRTVITVMELEKAVADDEGRGGPDAIVAGAALFAVYSRVRVGDLRRCIKEPELDLTDGVGFLETHFTEKKKARAGTKRALPTACPADGLTAML